MVTNQKQMAGSFLRGQAVLGALLAGVSGGTLHAQTIAEPVNELAFTAELRHDTNVARSDELLATRQGLRRSDERLSLGASFTLARPLGRNNVSVNAFLGYDFYRRNSQLNRERIAVNGDLDVNVGPCLVSAMPEFSRRQSDLYDIAFVNIPGIESVKNTETTQRYRGELRCGRAFGLRPMVFYERSWGDNTNAVRQIMDYRGEAFGGGLSYSHPVVGDIDLSLERRNLDYPNRSTASGLTGYRLDEARLALRREIGAVLSADGYIAYSHLKPENSGAQDFKGVSWSLGLSATPLPDLRLRGDFAQALKPSLGNDALYQRDRNLQLRATYQLTPKTAVSVTAGRNDRLYRGASGLFGPLLERDRIDRVSAGVDYRVSQRLGFGLQAGHERRNANGTIYDYNNTFVALNARFTLGAI